VSSREAFRIALRALRANGARSFLTVLGVAIGVAAVILLVSIGTGVRAEITGQISGLGTNLVFVFPGDIQQGGSRGGLTRRFTLRDARMLQTRVSGATAIVPIIQGPATARVGARTLRTSIAASEASASQVFTSRIAAGRHYNQAEVEASARVVSLAATPRNKLFPNRDPLGKTIAVNGQRFTVIGYYMPQGGGLGGDLDNSLYMPITTAQKLFGIDDINYIVVKVADPAQIPSVTADIKRLLQPRYGTDFSVFTQEQTLGVFSAVLGTLTWALAGIAAISLVVGGIGIMNIMLVSVTERTREIGVRKAVGAKGRDILYQFVFEAVLLSLLGGLAGIAIGVVGALAIRGTVPTQLSWWSVGLAFLFAAAVGVFFGVYPAWKASEMDPITALRYE
jgi:putative ABC transport system permease protein